MVGDLHYYKKKYNVTGKTNSIWLSLRRTLVQYVIIQQFYGKLFNIL